MGALSANRYTRRRSGDYVEYSVYTAVHIYAGSLVCIRTDGYAVPAADTSTYQFVGVAIGEADNTLGASGAIKVLVKNDGMYLLASSGLTQKEMGQTAFVTDDQTVATTSTNGIIAGKIIKVESATLCWVDIAQSIIMPVAYAGSDVSIADPTGIITAQEASGAITEIMKGVKTAQYLIHPDRAISLETGAPTVVFAGAGADGFTQLTNKEVGLRWNNAGNPTKMGARFSIPPDLDPTAKIVLHLLGAVIPVGAAVVDSPTFTVEGYFSAVGAEPLADADCGGTSGEFLAVSTYQEKTLDIIVADLPAVASVLTIVFNPTDGELGTDDFFLAGLWVEATRACLTS